MDELLLVALAGLAASMVDGALGMGFGPTSSTLLLSVGLSPASVSTTVNIAKIASGLAAGVSHWRLANIDRRLVLNLALPGAAGALVGVTLLSSVNGAALRPLLAAMLVLVGLRILLRFSRPVITNGTPPIPGDSNQPPAFDRRGVRWVAAAGGVTNGMIGAWGPVVTPFLLQRGLAPRYAVGSVNTAEVAVASASVFSLIASVGRGGLDLAVILAMLVGGVLGAPLAAWTVRYIPPRPMGLAVAALLLVTNLRELTGWMGLGSGTWIAYAALGVAVVLASLAPWLRASNARLSGRAL